MMDEKDILKQIMDSAEDIEVPESLRPENIEKRLKPNTISFQKRAVRYTEMAAALLCVTVGGYAVSRNMKSSAKISEQLNMNSIETEVCYAEEPMNMEREDKLTAKNAYNSNEEYDECVEEAMYEEEEKEENEEYEENMILEDADYQYELLSHRQVKIKEKGEEQTICAIIEPEDPSLYIEEIRVDGDRLQMLVSEDEKNSILVYDISNRNEPLYLKE